MSPKRKPSKQAQPKKPPKRTKNHRTASLAGRIFNDYTQNMQSEKLEERMWAKVNHDAIKKLQKKVNNAVAGV